MEAGESINLYVYRDLVIVMSPDFRLRNIIAYWNSYLTNLQNGEIVKVCVRECYHSNSCRLFSSKNVSTMKNVLVQNCDGASVQVDLACNILSCGVASIMVFLK